MSRRRWIGAAAFAVFVGCGSAPPEGMPSSGTRVDGAQARCAGIGPFHLTITRFVNQGSRVAFEGRYVIPSSGVEATLTDGVVLGAHYRRDLDVVSVDDSSSRPAWTLRDTTVPIAIRASTLTLTGEQLEGLKLHVAFTVLEAGRQSYELEFHRAGADRGGAQRADGYEVAGRDLNDPAAPATQHCMQPGGAIPESAGVDPDAGRRSTPGRMSRRHDANPRIASIMGTVIGS